MKSNNKELVKKTAMITVGNISTKLISFLLLPFYTHILTTAEYGTYDVLHSYIFLLVPVIGFRLDQAVFKHLVESRADSKTQKEYITTTTLFTAVQAVLYGVIFATVYYFWRYQYLLPLASVMINTVVLYNTQQMVRGINKTGLYAVGGVISSALTIILNIVFLTYFNMRVEGLLLAVAISSFVTIVFLWASSGLFRYLSFKAISFEALKKELKFGAPLVPDSLAWWVIQASDRTVVSAILGVAANGIIAVSQKFSSAYITVFNIFRLSWNETVILHLKDEDGQEYISKTLNVVASLFNSAAIGIIAGLPFVFSLLVDSDYNSAYNLVPIYMVATMVDVYMGMFSAVFIAQSKTKYMAFTSIVSGVINVAVHLLLIKFIGIYAAPVSTLTSYLIVFVIRYLKVKKETEIRVDFKKVGLFAVLLGITLVCYYINKPVVSAVCLLFDAAVCVLINKEMIVSIIQSIRKKLLKSK